MEAQNTPFTRLDAAREPYMRIHKRPVGPKTAERLFLHYRELSEFQDSQAMYEAGSAAAEAMLSGTHFDTDTRKELVLAAEECWQFALQLELERAAASAYRRETTPDRTREFRIVTALSRIPILEDLVDRKPTKSSLKKAQLQQLDITEQAVAELESARDAQYEGRAGTYLGVCNEMLAIAATDRLLSSRIIAFPSTARADHGYPYPEQTHDIQILGFHGQNIRQVTPLEAKNQLRPRHSMRYEAALLGGQQHLLGAGLTHREAVDLMINEAQGAVLTEDDRQRLTGITDSVIHVIRHWHRAEDFGRHCLKSAECRVVPQQRRIEKQLSA